MTQVPLLAVARGAIAHNILAPTMTTHHRNHLLNHLLILNCRSSLRHYPRTGNIGGLLARSTSSGIMFYGYDGSGNVTTLTDGTGAVVGSYTYDAWGNLLTSSGTQAAQNPYRLLVKEQLAGLTFYGYRFYSPGLGRWLNRDPIEEEGGVNIYAFVENNPVNIVDSLGLCGSILDPINIFQPRCCSKIACSAVAALIPIGGISTFAGLSAWIGSLSAEELVALGLVGEFAPEIVLPIAAGAMIGSLVVGPIIGVICGGCKNP